MALGSRARIVIAVIAVIVLAVFVPPLINVNRYRGRIANSIASAVGRPVTVGSVSLRLFPQPGFDLANVTVGEDPNFGIEPMLHAEEVTASLRMSSLWRGRLEIAKLSLKYPSLNLVRASDGSWNLESLLRHASRIPTAPTTQTRPESRPRFPYIEADGGRINLKIGQEKKVYALADADFALWLASENQLETRLAARLVRTDSYLSDTGTLRFNGKFQRAWDLRDTPMDVSIRLEKSQLGQLTKFIGGRDRGWRGAVDAQVKLSGTPADMNISAQTGVSDFRRYDIGSVETVNLNARCTAKYSTTTTLFSEIACRMPVGNGRVALTGALSGLGSPKSYDLSVVAEDVPMQAIVSLARHVKKDIPDDLAAKGNVGAAFTMRRADANEPGIWTGEGSAVGVVLTSTALQSPVTLNDLHWVLQSPGPQLLSEKSRPVSLPRQVLPGQLDKRLTVEPFEVGAGGTTPLKVSGWFSGSGYSFTVQGDSQITRLAQLAATIGMTAPPTDGTARLDLTIAGNWAGFSRPMPNGQMQIRAVRAKIPGFAEPVQINSGNLMLTADRIAASNLVASFHDAHLDLQGSISMPRQCDSVQACPIQFDLRAAQIATDDLNRLVNPRIARRPWYAILGNRPEPSILGRISATGQISVGRVAIKSVTANRVVAKVDLQHGQLALTKLSGDLWGGKHNGQFYADFTGDEPVYRANGTLNSAVMAQIGAAMRDNWASGAINATYSLSMKGYADTQLLASATGQASFDWKNGSLRHIALNGMKSPLSFRHFGGTVELRDGMIRVLPASKLAAPGGIYEVSGTASVSRQMDLTLRDGARAYVISGSLDQPKVSRGSTSQVQVSLKQ